MKIIKKMAITLTIVVLLGIIAGVVWYFTAPIFGASPQGAHLARLRQSPHYGADGFENLSPTEVMDPNTSYIEVMRDFLGKPTLTRPPHSLPTVKTDLRTLGKDSLPQLVWFGHSSYYIAGAQGNLLVDPVFSGTASPVSFFGKAFAGTDVYTAADFPVLDAVVISHDHYDHLDYETILALAPKVKQFVVPLGVGAHLQLWGIKPAQITELDWWQSVALPNGMQLTATPARHFSGRRTKRNETLWAGYVLQLAAHRLYLGGDSGYDTHFAQIAEKFGGFDLALLEAGQYGKGWPLIHMMPEETVQAAHDLRTAALMPVHWAKFELANHLWNEPIDRVKSAAGASDMPLCVPKIGEPVTIGGHYPTAVWWNF